MVSRRGEDTGGGPAWEQDRGGGAARLSLLGRHPHQGRGPDATAAFGPSTPASETGFAIRGREKIAREEGLPTFQREAKIRKRGRGGGQGSWRFAASLFLDPAGSRAGGQRPGPSGRDLTAQLPPPGDPSVPGQWLAGVGGIS